ncbi:disulfide bond formation protein B [Allochromatium palmeri]|uniref:Disulfide bond formation protein B n=1 Tax=Allochromatium palmeri TaxID=231048 RepID=A0A6N8ECX8_9GAMM|nr:disulfide bond formation protein B [Allochromatium palmeri]MTW22083.1 disulfide bond formation protein B [Allochromatium palmeri]
MPPVVAPRPIWVLLALMTATVALASFVLTPWLDLEPCHLCIFQRTLFMLMALLAALTAALLQPDWRRFGARLTGLLFLGFAALGSGVAAYQSWLQWQPVGEVSCIGGQLGPIERLVEWLGQQAPSLFMASGFCEDEQLTILGLSLANWAFLIFGAALVAGAWALWRSARRM